MRQLLRIFIFILLLILRTLWGLSSLIGNWVGGIIKSLWRIITSPISSFSTFKRHLKIAKFIVTHRGQKVLFYNYSNYKLVEKHLLPLLDGSFKVYFIGKEGIDSTIEDESVRAFLKHYEMKGGYPVLVKIGRRTYVTRSLKKFVTGLKNGELSSVYVRSQIKFFFENDDDDFEE
jgi:hypothetical protein